MPLNNTTSANPGKQLPCHAGKTTATEAVLKAAAYFVIMTVAVVGNSLLIRVITKTRRMRTPINHLLVSMAVSDLLTATVTMVIELYVYICRALARPTTWFGGVEGEVLCKLTIFIQGVAMASSVLTLVAIAANRFIAVVYPLRWNSPLKRSAAAAIVLIWSSSFALVSPILRVATVKFVDGAPFCVEEWTFPFDADTAPKHYTLALFGLLYAVPFVVILAFYSGVVYRVWMRQVPGNVTATNQQLEVQTKKRVLVMLITVVVVFVLCWLPYYIYLIAGYVVYAECAFPAQYFFFGLFLGHANSAINPCIYVIFNRDFRLGFQEAILECCCCCCGNADVMRGVHSRYASVRSTALQPTNLAGSQYSPSVGGESLTRRASRASHRLRSSPMMQCSAVRVQERSAKRKRTTWL